MGPTRSRHATPPSPRRRRTATTAAILALAVVAGVVGLAPAAGAVAPAAIRATVTEVDFGWTTFGAASSTQSITIRNEGPGTATGISVSSPTSDQFETAGTTCGSSLAEGATCTVDVRHTPSQILPAEATVKVSTTAGSATEVRLVGQTDAPAFALKVTPTGFGFGPQAVGTTSAAQTTTITNIAATSKTFTMTRTLPPGAFSSSGTTCSGANVVLAAGASCTVSWTFAPTKSGFQSVEGSLALSISGGGSRTYPVDLDGTGGSGAFPLTMTNFRLDFGATTVGVASAPQYVTLSNTSSAPVTAEYSGGAMPLFLASGGCGGSSIQLDPGESCQLSYVAKATHSGLQASAADIQYRIAGYPETTYRVTAVASATGTGPRLHVRSTPIVGPTDPGVASAPAVLTLVNDGNGPTSDLAITNDLDDVTIATTTTCGAVLAAGATCTISDVWTPASAGEGGGVTHYIEWGAGERLLATVQTANPISVHRNFVVAANNVFIYNSGDDERSASGDVPDVDATVAQLDAGTLSRRGYNTQLANSPEWVSAVVQGLYYDTLERQGDPGGVTFWTNRIRSGRNTVAQVAAEFYASSEYYNGIGGGTDTSWVTDLYVKLLERSPDAGGLQYWVGQTAAKGRVSVASRMFDSPESRRTRVANLYHQLLFRDPDPSGLAHWSEKIRTTGDIALAIELASSSEFLRLAQTDRF